MVVAETDAGQFQKQVMKYTVSLGEDQMVKDHSLFQGGHESVSAGYNFIRSVTGEDTSKDARLRTKFWLAFKPRWRFVELV